MALVTAVAQVQSLAWEHLYAVGVDKKLLQKGPHFFAPPHLNHYPEQKLGEGVEIKADEVPLVPGLTSRVGQMNWAGGRSETLAESFGGWGYLAAKECW